MSGDEPGSVRSTIAIPSAPGGIGAPVMIWIAVPVSTARRGAVPAARTSITESSTGAPTVSAVRTA